MLSSASITMASNVFVHSQAKSLIICHQMRCVDRSSNCRALRPTVSNIRFVKDSRRSVQVVKPAVSYSDSSHSSTSTSSLKSCMKSEPTTSPMMKKNVKFSSIEIKEHPRVLGDNPSVKKGPALSLGWYKPKTGRILKYSIDEFERRRETERRKSVFVSASARHRLLMEAGFTQQEIYLARKEASDIRRSRRDQNELLEFDSTAIAFENCIQIFKGLLTGCISEWELRELMARAEKSKFQQHQ